MKKIVIFGAGNIGKKAYTCLSEKYDIVAFADNNPRLWDSRLLDKFIISADRLAEYDLDAVVIATVHYKDIGIQLNDMGYRNIYGFELTHDDGESLDYNLFLLEYINFEDFNLDLFQLKPHGMRKAKKGDQKQVLMIAYSFPPEGGSAVQRPLKFAKYLQDFGYMPVVLTSGSKNRITSISDKSLEDEIPASVKVIRIDNTYSHEYLRSKEKLEEIFAYLYQIVDSVADVRAIYEAKKNDMVHILPDDRLFWEIECIKKIEDYIDMDDIDLIWSTVPSYSIHLLGYYFKKKYGIPWVADYRDLWTVSETYSSLYTWYTPKDIFLQRPLENMILKDADAIVVAGGSWIKLFEEELLIPNEKLIEITNGYDEADFAGVMPGTQANKKFTLCYNGRMQHENRNPCIILSLLNEMVEDDVLDKDEICWVINGEIKENFYHEMQEMDRYRIVCAKGEIVHRDCLQSGIDSNIMVFMGEAGENGWLNYPGKFYEYLRIGRPILCLTGHNSFQEKILKKTGLGENFDFQEKDKIKNFISKEYKKWKAKSSKVSFYTNRINRFDRKYLTARLADVFNEILGNV